MDKSGRPLTKLSIASISRVWDLEFGYWWGALFSPLWWVRSPVFGSSGMRPKDRTGLTIFPS